MTGTLKVTIVMNTNLVGTNRMGIMIPPRGTQTVGSVKKSFAISILRGIMRNVGPWCQPTYENDHKRYLCVPGHCGKDISKDDKKKKYVCYPDVKCGAQFAVVTALINAGIPMKQESIIMLTEFVAHPVAKNVP